MSQTIETLNRKLQYAYRQKAYAWAKYYQEVNDALQNDNQTYNQLTKIIDKKIPEHIKNELIEMATVLKKKWDCPICLDMIECDKLAITNCGHYYCKQCLEQLQEQFRNQQKWECAVCRRKHTFKDED